MFLIAQKEHDIMCGSLLQAQKIDDFYEYFTAPWAAFLYHEHVSDLMAMVKELRPKVICTICTICRAKLAYFNMIIFMVLNYAFQNEPEGLTLQEILRNFAKAYDAKVIDLTVHQYFTFFIHFVDSLSISLLLSLSHTQIHTHQTLTHARTRPRACSLGHTHPYTHITFQFYKQSSL